MAKTAEMTERQRKVQEVIRELDALPPGHKMTREEFVRILSKMPPMPEGWTSAEYIRELRGPLPEDDPEYQRNILGRR